MKKIILIMLILSFIPICLKEIKNKEIKYNDNINIIIESDTFLLSNNKVLLNFNNNPNFDYDSTNLIMFGLILVVILFII